MFLFTLGEKTIVSSNFISFHNRAVNTETYMLPFRLYASYYGPLEMTSKESFADCIRHLKPLRSLNTQLHIGRLCHRTVRRKHIPDIDRHGGVSKVWTLLAPKARSTLEDLLIRRKWSPSRKMIS